MRDDDEALPVNGPGDFVKVDCAGCGHTALLVREADRLALRPKLAPAFLTRIMRESWRM
jgi:hypothetical protein